MYCTGISDQDLGGKSDRPAVELSSVAGGRLTMLASGVGRGAEEWGRNLSAPVSCVVGVHARAYAQARLSAGGG